MDRCDFFSGEKIYIFMQSTDAMSTGTNIVENGKLLIIIAMGINSNCSPIVSATCKRGDVLTIWTIIM